jgi:hypothetical protein
VAPWPAFDEEHLDAVSNVLRSGKVNYWTGQEGRRFEQEFAELCACRYAVAVANGTVALELALAALGVGLGDEVIVTCRSFVASAGCCVMRGAVPVFADVDPVSQNVTAETIRPCISPRTKAIIAVHLAGWPCEMDPILELADEHGLRVIEDCAQAHGAAYKGRPVGSLGHAAAFSFCQDKILTTGGEGGMLVTNDEAIWQRAWSFKDHGKNWHAVHRRNHATVFKWLHDSIGTNGRLTEIQAALGRVQLRRLPGWLQARRKLAALLSHELSGLPSLRLTIPPAHVEHSYYKYYAFLRPETLREGWSRDAVVRAIQAEGIPCGSGICPEIYLERGFADRCQGRTAKRLPVAKELGETSLMLLVHPTLSETDVYDTCRAVAKVLGVAASSSAVPKKRAA